MDSEVAPGPGEPICFGCHAPLTGTMAMFGEIVVAAQALFAEVNAAGGVHGHPIALIVGDDRYDPAETPAVVERLLGEHKVFGFLMCVGTPPHLTVLGRLAAAHIPDLAVVTGDLNHCRLWRWELLPWLARRPTRRSCATGGSSA